MNMKYVENKKCDSCGQTNQECLEISKRILWVIPTKRYICQSCVSIGFRSFRTGR